MTINIENNVSAEIGAGLTSGTLLLNVKGGKHTLFPAAPFTLNLVKFNSTGTVLQREIVNVTSKAGNIFTITRAYEPVPVNDAALTTTQVAYDFDEGDMIYMTFTAWMFETMDADIQTRLLKAGGAMTGVLQQAESSDIVAAFTTNLATATWNKVHITWNTTITSFGTMQAGTQMELTFMGTPVLTHNATSLILPGGANITASAGDCAMFISEGGWNWRCMGYQKANGQAVSSTTDINWTTETTSLWDDYKLIVYSTLAASNRSIRADNAFAKLLSKFGDWSDWDVTITTTVTLTRDMAYNNLTITSPWVLDPNWFKVYVKGTLSGNGTIRRNGNTGGGGGFPWGGAGWAALNAGSLGAETAGSNGWTSGWVGTAGVSSNPCYSTTNGVAGVAWQYAGWAAWTSTRWSLYNIFYTLPKVLDLLHPASIAALVTQYKWGSGSWGGGGGDSSFSGWGSGSQWGTIWICAKIINFTGTMESKGWDWWPWTNNTNYGWNPWAGWSGWQGGTILLFATTFTSVGTQILTWWIWWAGGRSARTDARVTKKGNNGNLWVTIQVTI